MFLLENVKMKKEYQDTISNILGVEPIEINSRLVSAQNRKRLYWTNIPNVSQPKDKGIVWGDVREHGVDAENFYYTEKAMQWLGRHNQKKNKILSVHLDNEKMQMLEATHHKKYSSQRFFGIVDLPKNKQIFTKMMPEYLVGGKKQIIIDSKKQHINFIYDHGNNILTTMGEDNIIIPFTLPNRVPIGDYFFRYITPLECERLQTILDNYTDCVSNSQRYKMLGNGWTVDVIAHIFKNIYN